jgi:hypothetical protein
MRCPLPRFGPGVRLGDTGSESQAAEESLAAMMPQQGRLPDFEAPNWDQRMTDGHDYMESKRVQITQFSRDHYLRLLGAVFRVSAPRVDPVDQVV